MKKNLFTGSGVAIVTPMNQDGTVNYNKLKELIEEQIDGKTDAIVVCGTTGESPTLTQEEQNKIIETAVKKVDKKIPVIAGTGSNDTTKAVKRSQEAMDLGADGLLVVTPYYNKASQSGLIKHYTQIADSVDIPLIIYNIPSRTGCSVEIDTFKTLSKHENIAAVKEASGDISKVVELEAKCGNDLYVYSGNDDQIVPLMSVGGDGVISVLSNICPKQTHDICKLYLDGEVEKAAKLQLYYLDLIHALFMDINPIGIKEAMNLMGKQVGECRLPLCDMNDDKKIKLKNCLKKYDLI